MGVLNLKIEGLEDLKSDVHKAGDHVKSQAKWAMVQSVNIVKNDAQRNAPYKTGTLRRSIFTEVKGDGLKGIVGQDKNIASYGVHLEYGTKPHSITPVSKKALYWKGALNPYKRVMHPGFAARPYMFPALESNLSNIQAYFSKALLNLVKEIAHG